MAILTVDEQKHCARLMAKKLFVLAKATATRDTEQLRTIVEKIDEVMDATTTQLNTLYPGVEVENMFFQHARTGIANATLEEVGYALSFWTMKRVGLI